MDAAHITACSFEAWYPTFRHVTFRSAVLPLPPGFADFLVDDGVFLPPSSEAMPRRVKPDEYAVEGVDYTDWSSEDEGVGEGGGSDAEAAVSQFEEFRQQVNAAIADLGGRVLPKLNWSAPKDAAWVTATNSTACTNADEVFLLLQSSDRIAHDVCHAYDGCGGAAPLVQQGADSSAAPADGSAGGAGGQPDGSASSPAQGRHVRVLALRAWRDLRPGREFRCFVRGREVVGISQRDVTQQFHSLAEQREGVEESILDFHEDHIMAGFPLEDYTYDVYVSTNGTVKLVDFNPVGGTTAPLLFETWDQLGYSWAMEAAEAEDTEAAAGAGEAAEEAAAAASAASSQLSGPAAGGPATADGVSSRLASASFRGGGAASGSSADGGCQARGSQDGSAHSDGGRNGHAPATGGPPSLPDVDFRIITEPVVMRSAAGGYAVPYDFVDSAATGALADFVAQARQARDAG